MSKIQPVVTRYNEKHHHPEGAKLTTWSQGTKIKRQWYKHARKKRVVGAIVLSSADAVSQEPVLGSAQRVVVPRARAPRDAVVHHCLEYLGS